MNRFGRRLICIAGAVAMCVTARGDITPVTPAPYANTSLRQNTNVLNRILLMKKRHRMQNLSAGFPQFSHPVPRPGLPPANVPQLNGATAMAVHPGTASATASTDTLAGNPYESIVTRNVFGLNPIPPSAPPPPPQGPPPPKITLTGIMTIFGPAEALFKVSGVVRGNARPQDESYIFTEGEEQDEVEVTRIDTNKDIVTFMNHGVEQVIPLADGVASTGTGSGLSSPSWPGQTRHKFGRFGGFGGAPGSFQPQSYNKSPYGGGNSYANGNGNDSDSSQNGYNNPFNSNGQSSNYHDLSSNISPAISQLSPDDQAALVAAAHAQAEQDPNSTAPPEIFPPTQFDQEAADEAQRK
jgi:hypothetical protein